MMMEWLKLCILYVRASRKWKLGIPVGWFWVGMRRIETTVSPPNECDKQKHNDHKHTAHTQTDRQEEMFIYIGQKQSQRRSYTQNTHSIINLAMFCLQCTVYKTNQSRSKYMYAAWTNSKLYGKHRSNKSSAMRA